MAENTLGAPAAGEPKTEEAPQGQDASHVDLPSPKNGDRNAAISLSLSAGSAGSGRFLMDERLHKWLEEEASQMGVDTDSKQAGQHQKLHVKILVSNSASGSIIGKVGMNIHHTQTQTGAKIQLSKARQFFPGTNERTLLIRGNLGQIASAIYMIYLRLIDEDCAPVISQKNEEEMGDTSERSSTPAGADTEPQTSPRPVTKDLSDVVASVLLQIKLLIPEDLCGIIVGRSGSTIKVFSDTTNTSIRLLKAPKIPAPALSHQIVSIRGHLVDIIKAISLIILKQSDDPDYQNYGHLPRTYYLYGGPGYGVPHMNPGMMFMGNYPQQPAHLIQGHLMSIICPLTAEQQRFVLDNMSQITHYIQQTTGILLKLETTPDHEGFSVRLDGARDAVLLASSLLNGYVNPQGSNMVPSNVVSPY